MDVTNVVGYYCASLSMTDNTQTIVQLESSEDVSEPQAGMEGTL